MNVALGEASLARLTTKSVINNIKYLASLHLLQIDGRGLRRSVTLMYYSVLARRVGPQCRALPSTAFWSLRRSPARLGRLILMPWQFLSADQSSRLTGSQRGATPCCRWLSGLIIGRLRALFPAATVRHTQISCISAGRLFTVRERREVMLWGFTAWPPHCKKCPSNFQLWSF